MKTNNFRKSAGFQYVIFTVLTAFLGMPVTPSYAQMTFVMPPPGQMVHLTGQFEPAQMVGLKVNLKDPFSFDFIMDQGQTPMSDEAKKIEFNKMIKYFLVSLTMPNKEMWVNLSPYESTRIIPETFGQTEMGRDLLAQDYILKQLTASLIYPEDALGKKFWSAIYSEAQTKFGTTSINVNTFNKVWILADKADVYQKGDTAFLIGSHLKVMMEQDYMSIEKHKEMFGNVPQTPAQIDARTRMASDLVRQIVIPAIDREVNQGKSFAAVRQIYAAEIMATWFKRALRQSLLTEVFANKGKIAGQRHNDPQAMEKIYRQYLIAYKKGVFNYIKEDVSPDGQTIPRKYFSGGALGVNPAMLHIYDATTLTPEAQSEMDDFAMSVKDRISRMVDAVANFRPFNSNGQVPIVHDTPTSLKEEISNDQRMLESKSSNGLAYQVSLKESLITGYQAKLENRQVEENRTILRAAIVRLQKELLENYRSLLSNEANHQLEDWEMRATIYTNKLGHLEAALSGKGEFNPTRVYVQTMFQSEFERRARLEERLAELEKRLANLEKAGPAAQDQQKAAAAEVTQAQDDESVAQQPNLVLLDFTKEVSDEEAALDDENQARQEESQAREASAGARLVEAAEEAADAQEIIPVALDGTETSPEEVTESANEVSQILGILEARIEEVEATEGPVGAAVQTELPEAEALAFSIADGLTQLNDMDARIRQIQVTRRDLQRAVQVVQSDEEMANVALAAATKRRDDAYSTLKTMGTGERASADADLRNAQAAYDQAAEQLRLAQERLNSENPRLEQESLDLQNRRATLVAQIISANRQQNARVQADSVVVTNFRAAYDAYEAANNAYETANSELVAANDNYTQALKTLDMTKRIQPGIMKRQAEENLTSAQEDLTSAQENLRQAQQGIVSVKAKPETVRARLIAAEQALNTRVTQLNAVAANVDRLYMDSRVEPASKIREAELSRTRNRLSRGEQSFVAEVSSTNSFADQNWFAARRLLAAQGVKKITDDLITPVATDIANQRQSNTFNPEEYYRNATAKSTQGLEAELALLNGFPAAKKAITAIEGRLTVVRQQKLATISAITEGENQRVVAALHDIANEIYGIRTQKDEHGDGLSIEKQVTLISNLVLSKNKNGATVRTPKAIADEFAADRNREQELIGRGVSHQDAEEQAFTGEQGFDMNVARMVSVKKLPGIVSDEEQSNLRSIETSEARLTSVLDEQKAKLARVDDLVRPGSADRAELTLSRARNPERRVGGINLSDENLILNVKLDGAGMPLPAQYQDPAMMNIKGLTSVILSIAPVNPKNVPAFFELLK